MPEHAAVASHTLEFAVSESGARATPHAPSTGLATLRFAAAAWWLVALVGHVVFGAYILGNYGAGTLRGDPDAWNRVLPFGHAAGAPLGNLAVAIHVLPAFVVAIFGPLQLVPALRRRAPWLHRWNGRIYATVAIVVGLAGLAMIALGRVLGGTGQEISLAINGILLLTCAVLAWRRARARDFVAHRRWALRLFVLAAGPWFFRIGMAAWIAVNNGPVGFDPRTMEGPALLTLSIAQWSLPLVVLEIYFRAEQARAVGARYLVAALLVVLAIATGFGVYRATLGMWLPLIVAAVGR